ncbi:hypothetical protein EGW08_013273 [Elysia chlorotica]|uniref:Antistasin-like domain-containing protein n=1 Tax=Elysia chlorotica TaxID=188477 RepID=A0A3S1B9F3_ELYCH|nr:hypothetical protein EGW08_013273 [Elysia chlorotica]
MRPSTKMAARPVLSLLSLTLVLVLTDTALALPQLVPVGETLDPCFPIKPCKCPFGTVWSIDARGCPRCSCKPGCPPLAGCTAPTALSETPTDARSVSASLLSSLFVHPCARCTAPTALSETPTDARSVSASLQSSLSVHDRCATFIVAMATS